MPQDWRAPYRVERAAGQRACLAKAARACQLILMTYELANPRIIQFFKDEIGEASPLQIRPGVPDDPRRDQDPDLRVLISQRGNLACN